MQRTVSGAAGNGLHTSIKYMRGAAGIGLGTTIKHLRRTTCGAEGTSLGAAMKYLRCTARAAANNGLSTTPGSELPNTSLLHFFETFSNYDGFFSTVQQKCFTELPPPGIEPTTFSPKLAP
jgi:hypothetical protein